MRSNRMIKDVNPPSDARKKKYVVPPILDQHYAFSLFATFGNFDLDTQKNAWTAMYDAADSIATLEVICENCRQSVVSCKGEFGADCYGSRVLGTYWVTCGSLSGSQRALLRLLRQQNDEEVVQLHRNLGHFVRTHSTVRSKRS